MASTSHNSSVNVFKTKINKIFVTPASKVSGKQSFCWTYFGQLSVDIDGKRRTVLSDQVFCSVCLDREKNKNENDLFSKAVKAYSKNIATGNLLRHLKDEHDIEEIQKKKVPLEKFFSARTPTSRPESADDKKNAKWLLSRDLALWFARSLLPFDTVDDDAMIDLKKKYNVIVSDKDLPSRQNIAREGLEDIYTNEMKLIKYTLATKQVSKKHTGETIRDELKHIWRCFEISHKDFYLVTDAGSNVKRAAALLGLENHLCLGHALHNLVTVDGIQSTQEIFTVVQKCKKVVKHIRYRAPQVETAATAEYSKLLLAFEELGNDIDENEDKSDSECSDCQGSDSDLQDKNTKAGLPPPSINTSTPTRWHSTLMMLQSLNHAANRQPINTILGDIGKSNLRIKDSEHEMLEDIIRFLEKFKTVVEVLSSETEPTINLALVFRSEIKRLLLEACDDEPIIITRLKNNMLLKLNHRFPLTDLIIAAALLDCRFHAISEIDEFMEQNKTTKVSFLTTMVKKRMSEMDVPQSQGPIDVIEPVPGPSSSSTSNLLMSLARRHGTAQHNFESSIETAIESLHAPTGGGVELPCDVTPTEEGDQMGLVIWYKQGHEAPIYSLDTREGVTSHWSDPGTLGNRATFRSDTRPAVLVLTKLRPEDSGQYRCRVDFIKSQTKNTRLNLTVLIPPERLIILNQDGNEVQGGILGPYDDGTEVNLTCVAVGGRPTARVSWWKAHALLANSEARATVSFRVQRSDLGTEITCQAVTDPSIAPVSETLSIDVNLRPLWVRLQGGKRPLVAGQKTELVCQSVGARPKPSISWWKGGTRLKTVRETISTDGNITNSILTFEPSIEDAGRVLSCRASQPALPHSTHEDGWKMEIQHLPVVKLELGANLDASKVVEGSDVYLDCRVRANPWYNNVYFTHNNMIVRAGTGVLLANQSLVLQKVSRKAAGAYVCSARNALGEGSSEKLMLDVKYAPTCKSSQPAVLRAARGEIIEIECDLDANPKDSMMYHWWFNSSAHSKHELTAASALNAAQSLPGTYLYMVNTSADYGWVQCSGTNSVGRQGKPCLFHILPADKPSTVKSCEITNVTYDSLTLNCTPGHDGGIRQSFLLQVFDMGTGLLLANISSDEPDFQVSGLSASNSLSVVIKAYNRKGASEPLTLTSSLLKYPQRHTAQVPVKVELTTVLIVVLISVGVIATMIAVSATVFCCRHCNKKNNKNEKDKRQQDETSNIPLTGTKESDSVDSLDKNPDIIPLDGKISDSCSNKSSTTDYSSVRPLISKNPADKYDSIPPNCDRYYDHNIDPCNHYIQVRPIEYRVRPTYQPSMNPMANLGPSIQSIGPMSSLGVPNDCHRPPYDKVYEDWLKYKNALPLNTSGLLPAEQLMPPELYATPPPSLYSNPRAPLSMGLPDLEPRYHMEPRLSMDARSCSNSPPVRFNPDHSVYYNKERNTSTLPHLKRINGNTMNPKPSDPKQSGPKTTDSLEPVKMSSQECG